MIMQVIQVLMAYPLCNLPCGDHVRMPQIVLRHGRTIVTHKHGTCGLEVQRLAQSKCIFPVKVCAL